MMDRRSMLKLGAGAALYAAFPLMGSASAATFGAASERRAPFVRDDIGKLGKVLVHSPTVNDYTIDRLNTSLIPGVEGEREDRVRQHGELLKLLRQNGAEPVELTDALQGAIDEARHRGSWRAWLSAAHPRLSGEPGTVTASTLLGRDSERQFQRQEDGTYRNLFSDSRSTIWTRDAGFMAPGGLVVCNAASARRLRENMTLRFALSHSPQLSEFPVVFDAVNEGLILEGGDAQVVDEQTLFLGTGQQSDPRAAPMLARRLDMDVVAVQVHKTDFRSRRPGGWGTSAAMTGLRLMFLHLDTFFTHVGHKHALAMPWLLEAEHTGKDPLSRYIEGARADLAIDPADATAGLEFLKEFGKVTVYRAGSGEKEDMGEMKLVDYVRSKGYTVSYVGGREPEDSAEGFAFFLRETMGELRRQAANVIATSPGEVIAYEGSPLTRASLEAAGISVRTFGARELWANHGGPHCLTMPLVRG
ncbi:MAG: hypothetical protein EA364_15845 [Balneolaceae bacterium]|nr:MAG: hypothetical protein EA364_15845 [Balneolaceae bacterium]